MLEEANIQPSDKVLEPSAGKGDIAEALVAAGAAKGQRRDLDVVEINPELRKILEKSFKTR
jgi:16S rRNA A1518/A1519 N6-dimethyltransferase RsmA/KsgA/DIM1 with predicted DNA glycosylase/AP lyase activity